VKLNGFATDPVRQYKYYQSSFSASGALQLTFCSSPDRHLPCRLRLRLPCPINQMRIKNILPPQLHHLVNVIRRIEASLKNQTMGLLEFIPNLSALFFH
jgi:hypothetical protein